MTDDSIADDTPAEVASEADIDADGVVTPEEQGRSLRKAATLTAVVGIAFSVLFTVSFVLMVDVPPGTRPTTRSVTTTARGAGAPRSLSGYLDAVRGHRIPVVRGCACGCGRSRRRGV